MILNKIVVQVNLSLHLIVHGIKERHSEERGIVFCSFTLIAGEQEVERLTVLLKDDRNLSALCPIDNGSIKKKHQLPRSMWLRC